MPTTVAARFKERAPLTDPLGIMGPTFEAPPRSARTSAWIEAIAFGGGGVVVLKVLPDGLDESPLVLGIAGLVALAVFAILVVREVSRTVDAWHRDVPAGPVPCPRCRTHDRAPLGWCAQCAQLLAKAGLPAPAQVSRFVGATLRRDLEAAAGLLAPELVTARPGERLASTREAWQGAMASFHRWSRRETSVVLASYGDPDDPTVGWVREHARTQGTFGLMRLDADLVSSYRLNARGQIAEITVAEPLAPGGPVPVASATTLGPTSAFGLGEAPGTARAPASGP